MIKNTIKLRSTLLLFFSFVVFQCNAQDFKVSIGQILFHSEYDSKQRPRGGFVDLFIEMRKVYNEGNLIFTGIFPIKRSMLFVEKGEVDIHFPLIKSKHNSKDDKPFIYSAKPLGEVVFVLYTKADQPELNMESLSEYKIYAQSSHSQFISFKVGNSGLASGIEKINRGLIDGFIAEQDAADSYIREKKYKFIRRELFKKFKTHFIISKGINSKIIDKKLTSIVNKLEKSGRLNEIMSKIHAPYDNWQPHKMDW